MNASTRAQWILSVAVAGAPFAGVVALRTLAGVGGPQPAHGAPLEEGDASTQAEADAGDTRTIAVRSWVVPPSEASRLGALSAEQVTAWTEPLFPVEQAEIAPAVPDQTPVFTSRAAPAPPTAARFADLFRVTSLMATRDGAVAVIDRKLRRVGEELGEGVTVEAIDLAGRLVVLRTAEGVMFERRAAR